ncbi:MAG TPA: NAD-dependent epimerase/dehydratase family protein [Sphingomonas sp.]|jgi:nucleoside-diphosphate-sugar epimerase|uniref:NAD-dependent epimerase/dehydratase family protein n=1 Tax=Sphingomonas sp. TaxID=28214 RepID=UPI002EDAA88E
MTTSAARILVTGAGGFIGRQLCAALRADPAFADARLVLLDTVAIGGDAHARIETIQGDLGDPAILAAAVAGGVDLVYHLAGVVGGAAEADHAAARRVNIDATLDMFERLRDTGRCPRVVYASSIAVFGEPPPPAVDDDTAPRPTMVYGAHKRTMEIALAQFSARGWLDGLSVRLPAIVAKPAAPGVPAVFLNRIFHVHATGEAMTVPVSPEGTIWLLSTQACVEALLHAGRVPLLSPLADRTITLPALRVTIRALIDTLARHYPDTAPAITFAPRPALEAQFASQPPLVTSTADRLGFRHDGDLDRLVRHAIA